MSKSAPVWPQAVLRRKRWTASLDGCETESRSYSRFPVLCLTPGSLLHVSRNFNLLPTTGTQETVFQVGQLRTRFALTNVCSLPQLPELMATACCVAVVDKSVSRGF